MQRTGLAKSEARLYNHHRHTMATFPYNLCNQRIKTISCNSATQLFFNQILIYLELFLILTILEILVQARTALGSQPFQSRESAGKILVDLTEKLLGICFCSM